MSVLALLVAASVTVRQIAQIALVCAHQLVIARRSAGAPIGGYRTLGYWLWRTQTVTAGR